LDCQIVESIGSILLNLTFAYPKHFGFAAVAAHGESKQRLSGFRPLELDNGVHSVISPAHFYAQNVFMDEVVTRIFGHALGWRTLVE
jgi:hypothetical protein